MEQAGAPRRYHAPARAARSFWRLLTLSHSKETAVTFNPAQFGGRGRAWWWRDGSLMTDERVQGALPRCDESRNAQCTQ
jgi:hypothetical protein